MQRERTDRRRATACYNGHPYAPGSFSLITRKGDINASRRCLICDRARNRRHRARKVARLPAVQADPIALYHAEKKRYEPKRLAALEAFDALSRRVNEELDLKRRGGRPAGTRTLSRISVGKALYGEGQT